MGEALGGHGKRRRNIAPNTGPAGHGLGVKTKAVQVYQDPQAKPVAGAEEALQLIDGPVGAPAAELSVVSRGAHGGAHRRGTRGWGAG